jgi:uncharacterized protein YaeQ
LALTATIYNFDVELADADRGRYESLAVRVARHPSESEEYLATRVLAYLLEYTEGIALSRGLSDTAEPAILVRDLTGAITSWIEVGAPDAERLHKASKAAPRVAVYIHKDSTQYLKQLAGARVHRAEAVELVEVDRSLVVELVARLDRRMALTLAVTGGVLYLSIGNETFSGSAHRLPLP